MAARRAAGAGLPGDARDRAGRSRASGSACPTPATALVLAMLVAVDVLGEINKGAQRWLDLGFIQLQPSELMKVALVMALARYFHAAYLDDLRRLWVLVAGAAADPDAVRPGAGPARPRHRRDAPGQRHGAAVHGRRALVEVRGRGRSSAPAAAAGPLGQPARLSAPARLHLPRPRGRPAGLRLPHHPVQDRARARAASGGAATCTAARPSSASCPRSTPTSPSPCWPRSWASSAPSPCWPCSWP